MGAALRLGNDAVDDAQLQQVRRRQLHQLTGFLMSGGVLPQNGGEAFRREDGVHRVLQHQHPVGNAQRQRAAAVALAGDEGDDGDGEAAHLIEIPGDGLALAVGLGLQAGIGAGGVDKREDGAAELLRLAHQPQSLAVPFRIGHAEVALEVLLQRFALPGADDGHRAAVVQGHAAQDRGILAAEAVALLLKEVCEQRLNIICDIGPLGVAGNGHPLGGGQRFAHVRPPFSWSRSSWDRVSRI